MDITKFVDIAEWVIDEDQAVFNPYSFYDVSISANLALYEKPYKTVVIRLSDNLLYNFNYENYIKIDEGYILKNDYELLLRLQKKGIYFEDGDFLMVISYNPASMEDRINSYSGGPRIGRTISWFVKEKGYFLQKKDYCKKEILNGHELPTLIKNPLITTIDDETAYVLTKNYPYYLSLEWMYVDFSKVTIDNITFESNEDDRRDYNPTHIVVYLTDSVGNKYVMRLVFDYMLKYPAEVEDFGYVLTFDQIDEAFRGLPYLWKDVAEDESVQFIVGTDVIYKLEDYLKTPTNEKSSISINRFSYELLQEMGIEPLDVDDMLNQ